MKLTKILAMLLALCMILCCFAACGSSDKDDDDDDEKVEEKDKDDDEDEDEDEDDDKKSDKDDEDEDKKPSKKPSKDEDDEDDKKSDKDDEDDIQGDWVLAITFMELMEIGLSEGGNTSGVNVDSIMEQLDTDASIDMHFIFDDDEITMLIDGDEIEDAVDEFIDDYLDYLKDGGLEALYRENGYTMDQLEDELEASGMTMDDLYDMLEETLAQSLSQLSDTLTIDKTTTFEFDGSTVEFENGSSMDVKLSGDSMKVKSIDGDSVSGAFADFIEGRTLKRD